MVMIECIKVDLFLLRRRMTVQNKPEPVSVPVCVSGNIIPLTEAAVVQLLQARLAEILGKLPADVPINARFDELGADSLAVVELLTEIEDRLQIRLHPGEITRQVTVSGLADYICREAAARSGKVDAAMMTQEARDAALDVVPQFGNLEQRPQPASPARNPPIVLLVCAPRSGSTLLRVMLAGHPRLFSPPELHLLSFSTMKARHDALAGSYLDEGLQRAVMELAGGNPDRAREQIAEWVAANLPVQKVYATLQREAGNRMLVDKSPTYATQFETLQRAEELFDKPKYIWLTRHPSAAIESIVRHRLDKLVDVQGMDSLMFAEQLWLRCNTNLSRFFAGLDTERWRRVRFEDLVANPESACRSLCEFLGLPFDVSLLTPYEGQRMTDGLNEASLSVGDPGFLKHSDIEPEKGAAWRNASLIRQPDDLVRKLATELGYEMADRRPVPPVEVRPTTGKDAEPGVAKALVTLQERGDKPPLFFVHPAGGAVFSYYELAKLLGDERPFIALQDPSLRGGGKPCSCVEDYAKRYVDAVRLRQPKGPYFLGGWSFGGHVVFEMACSLRAMGEDVALVLLIDTEASLHEGRLPVRQRLLHRIRMGMEFAGMFSQMLAYIRAITPVEATGSSGSRIRRVTRSTYARHGLKDIAAVLKYRPPFYPGTVVIVRAARQKVRRYFVDDTLGWSRLALEVRVHQVQCTHMQLVQSAHIHEVASIIRRYIESA